MIFSMSILTHVFLVLHQFLVILEPLPVEEEELESSSGRIFSFIHLFGMCPLFPLSLRFSKLIS